METNLYKAMLKRVMRGIILLASIFVLGCSLLPLDRRSNYKKPSPTGSLTSKVPLHCAANSLYALCAEWDIPASLQLCMELLPPRPGGNSMLEFKNALLSLGFEVDAQKLNVNELANIRAPSILLVLPPENLEGGWAPPFAHYVVLWPLDKQRVRILDYPRESVVFSVDYLIRDLRSAGITNIPVLLCSNQGLAN